MKPTKDSLVLYKQAPALVTASGVKIDILLPGGKNRSVREKDVFPLHPGPVPSFPNLEDESLEGAPEEAWELLQGESPSFVELTELVYGSHTPASSWQTFKLINRSPWFKGTPDAIEVADAQAVSARKQADEEKAQAERRWKDFIHRFQNNRIDKTADEPFLRDLEMYALGRSKGSRILKALGKTQSPENAHRVMLSKGIVGPEWNPHPLRLDAPMDVPQYPINPLPREDRLDLTAVEAFAIDDEGNQDPDDALAWDGRRLWVHVADAAALIPAGSDADLAARDRSSSLYLPEKTVPMLPPEAVSRLGLGLDKTSPAQSYALGFDDEWNIVDFSVHLTRVRVTRMSYAQADEKMDREPFKTMQLIAEASRNRRKANGSVSINLPEVKIRVDPAGEIHITPLGTSAAREMVMEAMLLAGSEAAKLLNSQGIPAPYVVQDGADGEAVSPSDDLAEQHRRRRSMKRSRTTLTCSPHAGLGLDAYVRVTSPLRRYPDLVAARQIRLLLREEPTEGEEEVLAGLAAFEFRLGSLVQAERRSNQFWKILWLSRRPEWTGKAVLVEKRGRQAFFLIPQLAMETRVTLKNDIAVGAHVVLALKGTDIAESTALFTVEEVLD